ncbi:MAG: hypothetical protein QF890_04335 [Myxococcota bacterium]|nr:hypothetical protein [bacterium]MDP6076124.1 hypothetical protein [Myxococcota bacterium]MDP6244763.1 hypothetical protein [Myxococcota bacterium]MDP7073528.1 hypothetical protein [Myxococcota bacterium]MDP7300684.1 hypothetical protein [Myxococcota bacterium]
MKLPVLLPAHCVEAGDEFVAIAEMARAHAEPGREPARLAAFGALGTADTPS